MKTYDAYLCGYYGMKNTGDDALLFATAWGAQNFLNVRKMAVSAPCKMQIPEIEISDSSLSEKQFCKGHHRLQHYLAAVKSKRVIFGGGSVLHTASDIKMKTDMIRFSGQSGIAVGVGVGPFADVAAESACAEFLRRCEHVGLRDAESFAIANAIAPDANLVQTFDLAPQLLCAFNFSYAGIERRGIAINLCPVGKFDGFSGADLDRVNAIAQVILRFWNETGEPIDLIDFNGHEQFGDSRLHQLLKAKLPGNVNVNLIPYNPNPLAVLQQLASYRCIMSMRLHGAIMGFMANTPVLSLNYHSKCAGWCDQIGMPFSNRFDVKKLNPDLLSYVLMDGIEHDFLEPRVSLATAIRLSLSNWSFCHESVSADQRRYSFV